MMMCTAAYDEKLAIVRTKYLYITVTRFTTTERDTNRLTTQLKTETLDMYRQYSCLRGRTRPAKTEYPSAMYTGAYSLYRAVPAMLMLVSWVMSVMLQFQLMPYVVEQVTLPMGQAEEGENSRNLCVSWSSWPMSSVTLKMPLVRVVWHWQSQCALLDAIERWKVHGWDSFCTIESNQTKDQLARSRLEAEQ